MEEKTLLDGFEDRAATGAMTGLVPAPVDASPASFGAAPPPMQAKTGTYRLALEGSLAWTKTLLGAQVGGGEPLELAIYSVAPATGPVRGNILVFPGLNGLPRQVAGLDAPDYPDRPTALRFAEAGYGAHVVDYCPGSTDRRRSEELAALASRMRAKGRSAAAEMASLAMGWFEHGGDHLGYRALAGHSLGAFVAALGASQAKGPLDLVLASGVVPLTWLTESSGKASPLHQLPPAQAGADFGQLLATDAVARVQIQYGTADTIFGLEALRAGAVEVTGNLGPRAQCIELTMGHGTNARAAIDFYDEGSSA